MSILQLAARCIPIEWHVPLELSPRPSAAATGVVDRPGAFIHLLNGWELAQWATQTSQRLQFWTLPKPASPGAPETYRDGSVLLTSLVAAAWRLSYERTVEWLARYDALAELLGTTNSTRRGSGVPSAWLNTRDG